MGSEPHASSASDVANREAAPSTAKAEAQAQWGNDPAGNLAARNEPLGTPESFARVEAHRYAEQPWMHDTFRFSEWEDKRVLEVGVGLGTDHLQFVRAGAATTGIDLTPLCVEMTTKRLEQEGFAPDIHQMDAEDLHFPDDSFDAVYSFGVLHHTESAEGAFREIRRVLRPGGVFMGGLYAKYSYFILSVALQRIISREGRFETWPQRLSRIEYSNSDSQPYVRLFTGSTLRRALGGAGFESVDLTKRHVGLGRRGESLPTAVSAVGGWYLIHRAS